ncbi:RadC family protein [Neptuniibacter sp.]|uniref:JAB domain-containing protein n=1 Tax=Neptuniibacter sp. TaxID=1962643 RepID=UPI00262E82C9|nr:DNA repair protein RadC [Neptuniibacter sp.]MCP4596148.1 DNA repair protein RadC [Neptuniibacter sp.]
MIKYSEYEQEAINVALSAIQQTLTSSDVMDSPKEVQNYLTLKLAAEPDEWFGVMFLTNKHRLISFERLFRGTVNASHVHIRVIARKALEFNAAAVILAHNHPSGIAEPSSADQSITTNIKEALQIFDVRVLDHFIVSPGESCSLAERGWL